MIGNRSGESAWQRRQPNTPGRALCRIFLTIGLFTLFDTPNFRTLAAQPSADVAAQEKEDCTKNLKVIYDAIEGYRKAHNDLPNWLSDLVPDYLPDANILICPVCRRTGQIEKPPLADPNIASSYLFEFCPAPLGNGAPGNPSATRREWKERQMAIVGPIVPIVRCRHHQSPLNLAFDGRIYESPPSWERMLTNTVDPKSLTSAQMFAAVASASNSASAKKTSAKRGKAPPQIPDAAQMVRVTAMDLAATDHIGKTLDETARQLNILTPDVILLRGITGWKTAAQLANALEPPYRVVACSGFGATAKFGTNSNQLAILARKAAYFFWSEPASFQNTEFANGAFTLAAINIAGHRFAFVSVNPEVAGARWQARLEPQTASNLHPWLERLNSYRAWSTNRLEGFVIAAFQPIPMGGETERALRLAGFHDPSADSPNSAAFDLIEAHLVPNADVPHGLLLSKTPLTCDFDFYPAPVVVMVTNSTPVAAVQGPPMRSNAIIQIHPIIWWIAGGMALVFLAIITLLIGIRRRLNRLQAQNALVPVGSYNLLMPPPTSLSTTALVESASNVALTPSLSSVSQQQEPTSQHGLLSHFAQWLKQAFVQRLLSDRQKLLDEQHVAARKVTSVDERLARLETKIQQQTAAYEKEIELLNQKLLSAREENLELIRSQIKFLKSEMETTRARVLESEEL